METDSWVCSKLLWVQPSQCWPEGYPKRAAWCTFPNIPGPRKLFPWGRCGSTRRLVLCHSPWFLLLPRAVSTDVQKSFPLQGWVPSHYSLSWWALPSFIQLSLHHARLVSHGAPFTVLIPISAMAFPLLSSFPYQPCCSLYCPCSDFSG